MAGLAMAGLAMAGLAMAGLARACWRMMNCPLTVAFHSCSVRCCASLKFCLRSTIALTTMSAVVLAHRCLWCSMHASAQSKMASRHCARSCSGRCLGACLGSSAG